ncbi:MAG: cation transporter [Chloroflexota bacterium]|nr:cation transporter [Chloroflexota bacterium]
MTAIARDQAATRERTLLVALLLSAWGPLATGIAVVTGRSSTQLADFVRRSAELIALFVSWWVFRRVEREEAVDARKARLERGATLSVAAAMGCSGLAMLSVALLRLDSFQPGGNVYPGLAIAVLGLVTNVWFWRRYAVLNREEYNSIIAAQRQLYRAKASVDLCVIVALLSVALAPRAPLTRYMDVIGSVAVALYMVCSAVRAARSGGSAL